MGFEDQLAKSHQLHRTAGARIPGDAHSDGRRTRRPLMEFIERAAHPQICDSSGRSLPVYPLSDLPQLRGIEQMLTNTSWCLVAIGRREKPETD